MPDDQPVRLPGGAPDSLKRFVACTTDRVELDLGDLGWVPKPDLPGNLEDVVTPGATVEDGWTPTSATIRVGYGEYISISLPASIVDGELRIDTANLGFGIGPEIDKWVAAFNRTLRGNGKQLDALDVRDGKVNLTKRAIPAATGTGAAATAPVTTAVPGTTPADEPEQKSNTGCFAWLAGAFTAIAVAIGLVVANSGDDGNENAVVTPTAAPGTTSTTTSTTTIAPTPTTTIAEVGQAPPPVTDAPAIRVCGGESGLPSYSSGSYIREQPGSCAPGPDSYTNAGCDPTFLPCSDGTNIVLVDAGNGVGIDHTRSVPDANTGEDGASTAEQAMWIRLFGFVPDSVVLEMTSDCGGTLLTGQTPVTNDAINVVEQPLRSFGECTIVDAGLRSTDGDLVRQFPGLIGGTFVVGPDEPDPELPSAYLDLVLGNSQRFTVLDDWLDSTKTIGGVIGANPIEDDNFWFFSPDNTELIVKVLDGSSLVHDRFWVFAAGMTDAEVTITTQDTLVGHGGAYVNEFGAPHVSDVASPATPHPLDAWFPCGPGDVAFTACPPGAPPLDASGFVAVSGAMIDPIPVPGDDGTDRIHTIDFAPSGGPTYDIVGDGDGWRVMSSEPETRARAIIRHNSLTLLAPEDEFDPGELSYQWSTSVLGTTVTQPVTPVAGVITTPSVGAVLSVPGEDRAADLDAEVADFYASLSASLSSGDLGFAVERLDPTVIEAFPTECPAALESFVDPDLVITPISIGERGPWTWELGDGRTFEIPDALPVTITLTGRGQTGAESVAHLTTVDGEYRWFTICGTP